MMGQPILVPQQVIHFAGAVDGAGQAATRQQEYSPIPGTDE